MEKKSVISRLSNSRGITLIELIIAIVIIGILASVAAPTYVGYIQKARNERAGADIRAISLRFEMFRSATNNYPANLAQAGTGNFLDPWDRSYQYLNIQTSPPGQARRDRFVVPLNTDYDLYSMGPDGQSAGPLTARVSRDDIVRANNGEYIGPADGY